MSRSIKKGPYVHASLQKKIEALNASNDKKVCLLYTSDAADEL